MQLLDFVRRMGTTRFLSLPDPLLRLLVGPAILSPEGWALDLQFQALLWLMRVAREESEYSDVVAGRAQHASSSRVLAPRGGRHVRVQDRDLPGGDGPRRTRIYSPAGSPEVSPGLLWFHGGGFALGSIDSHDGLCREISEQAGVTVLSVDYRLAPENRFPAGLNDAIAVTRWVLQSGRKIGIDPDAVAVGGDSAGGNLAAVVAQTLRDSDKQPVFQLLAYPPTDATCGMPAHQIFADGFLLSERTIQWFLGHYIADRRLETDPRVSPLHAKDLSRLPPALVITAGFDPLRDEGCAYADRMRSAGVTVEYVCAKGSIHGFLSTAGGVRESAKMLADAAASLRAALRR